MRVPENPSESRLDWSYLTSELLAQLNLEKGVGFTLKSILQSPGETVAGYLFHDRRRYVRPITLLLLMVALATLVSLFCIPSSDALLDQLHKDPEFETLSPLLQRTLEEATVAFYQYFNVIYISSLPLLAVTTWLLLRQGLSLVEHFVINAYVLSAQTLMYVTLLPLMLIYQPLAILQIIPTGLWTIFAFCKIFDLSLVRAAVLSFVSIFFANVVCGILIFGGFYAKVWMAGL